MKSSWKAVSHDETRQLAPCDELVEIAHLDEHIAGCHECQKRLQRRKHQSFVGPSLNDVALAEHIGRCQRCQIGCHK
jgi:hypothetical protein